jgi:hypothetical protein
MSKDQDSPVPDEFLFDQLKDQFVLFYALTMAAMEVVHLARQHYLKQAKRKD